MLWNIKQQYIVQFYLVLAFMDRIYTPAWLKEKNVFTCFCTVSMTVNNTEAGQAWSEPTGIYNWHRKRGRQGGCQS